MRWIGLICAMVLLTTFGAACQANSTTYEEGSQALQVSSDQPSSSATAQEPNPPASEPSPAPTQSAEPDRASPAETPAARETRADDAEAAGIFADNAFPPTIPDTEWHQNAWLELDCLRCHETGVGEAAIVVHADMPAILLTAKCRSCHVLIPGSAPKEKPPTTREEAQPFLANAFPPMMPNSESHGAAWTKDDCLLCHETGIRRAPVVKHEDLPAILLEAKCRSCHVQVRAVEPGRPPQ